MMLIVILRRYDEESKAYAMWKCNALDSSLRSAKLGMTLGGVGFLLNGAECFHLTLKNKVDTLKSSFLYFNFV